jgi:hypothetical protein
VARLAGAVLGGCLAWTAAPADAQDAALQAARAGRLYALVADGGRFTVAETGQAPLALAADASLTYDALAALDSGWLLAGHRLAPDGSGRELVLLRGGGGEAPQSLPVPPSGSSSIRGPQPLVEAGELMGLAWLEGSGSVLGVRAASWNGSGFTAAEWVSPPASGSQLALSATVLLDGSWLLVWSAFDGNDDEILWSRRDGPAWSAPARLHADNAVPDITPVVAATAGGAVAAWSRYEDGHYRVRMARLRGGAWGDEQRLGGAGSVFPFFVVDDTAGGPQLVFPEVGSGEWELIELTSTGQVETRSRFPAETRARPLVRRGAGGGARLQWLGDGAGSRP